MKLIAKLYRVTTIRTAELLAVLGKDPDCDGTSAELAAKIRERFGRSTPRFNIFYPSDLAVPKTVVGMEAMSFDVREANVPMAGIVMADPLRQQDVDRIDGAIEAELNRMGIWTEFIGFEWRMAYEIEGN